MSDIVRRPPFLLTYWKPWDEDSSLAGSWFNYVKDVSVAEYAASCIGSYIRRASDQQLQALEVTSRNICGTLNDRFDEVQQQLAQIGGALRGVNQRPDLVADEIRTRNLPSLEQRVYNHTKLLLPPSFRHHRQHPYLRPSRRP